MLAGLHEGAVRQSRRRSPCFDPIPNAIGKSVCRIHFQVGKRGVKSSIIGLVSPVMPSLSLETAMGADREAEKSNESFGFA